MWGGMEAGGTNFVCAVGSGPEDLIKHEFRTTTPENMLAEARDFFRNHSVKAIGVGSFGPVDLQAGRITATPKPGWQNFAFVEELRKATSVETIVFDTDVNTAAMGEHIWGAAQHTRSFLYITVGTGIGGGAMLNGQLLHGFSHPEMGHLRIPHDMAADPFPGCCYAHGDCLEGLASGPAIEKRWGVKGAELPHDHPAWKLEAKYLAFGLVNAVVTLSPELVVMGGGVMYKVNPAQVREEAQRLMNGYAEIPPVVLPGLGEDAGVLGALALAMGDQLPKRS